jgi:hypothetical protein
VDGVGERFFGLRSKTSSPQRHPMMTSQGTAHGRFQPAIQSRNVQTRRWRLERWATVALATRSCLIDSRRLDQPPRSALRLPTRSVAGCPRRLPTSPRRTARGSRPKSQ